MPEGWVLKQKITLSKKFRKLYGEDFAQLIYCMCIACKDNWGLIICEPDILKIKLGPYDYTREPEDYLAAIIRLAQVELVFLFRDQGDLYIYVEGHEREHPMKGRRGNRPTVPIPSHDDMERQNKEIIAELLENKDISSRMLSKCHIGTKMGSVSATETKMGSVEPTETKSGSVPLNDTKMGSVSTTETKSGLVPATGTGSEDLAQRSDRIGLDFKEGRGSATASVDRKHLPPSFQNLTDVESIRVMDEIRSLVNYHCTLWKRKTSNTLPLGDDLERIARAVLHSEVGLAGCEAAIRGQFKLASKDGSQHGKQLRHVFPALRYNGQKYTTVLAIDRVHEFIEMGGGIPKPEDKQAREDEQRRRKEQEKKEAKAEAELAKKAGAEKLKGPERAKAILRYQKTGKKYTPKKKNRGK